MRHKFIGAMPSGLSLRGPNGAVAISGRHSQPVQAAVKMEKAEIWGVAALSERLAGCRFGGIPPTARAL